MNASSGRDAASVTANSERGEHVGVSASFENSSGNNNVLHVSNVNDETRHNIPNEVIELWVPEARFDQQTHSSHGDRTNNPNKSNPQVPYRTHFNTTQPNITPTSKLVNTNITRQHFANG